jgi:hypothetical protein
LKFSKKIILSVKSSALNFRGKKVVRKIVIIESDDWGTIRMSSKKAFQSLLNKGYPVDQCPYNTNDALESNQDLEMLFEVLASVKGSDGKPAVLTANNIVANPDFDKIENSDFQEYYFEPFTETLKRYPAHDKLMYLYKQGIKEGVVQPQFHGREHLNITRWMRALQKDSKVEKDAFSHQVFSPKISNSTGYINEYMDALDFESSAELELQKSILVEGLNLFNQIWGFNSNSFIAPCYIWHNDLEETLAIHNVKYLQGLVIQLQPKEGSDYKYKKRNHYQGQKNKFGQRYFIRNAFFEPTISPNFDWESDCLKRIEIAFAWEKPAIISTHRLNFIGSLNPKNREYNLKRFHNLLKQITIKWPDVQFMSTDQLGQLYDT